MIEINTKIGSLFVEEIDKREENERIKVYDSLGRYFDYFSIKRIYEDGYTLKKFYTQLKLDLAKKESIDELLEYFGASAWTACTKWEDLIDDIYDGYAEYRSGDWIDIRDDSVISEKSILKNEWVNKIGETFIFVREN